MTVLCAVCFEQGKRTIVKNDPADRKGKPDGICMDCADYLLNIQFRPKLKINKRHKISVQQYKEECESCGNPHGIFKVITLTRNKALNDTRYVVHAQETLCGLCAAKRTDGMLPVGETTGRG